MKIKVVAYTSDEEGQHVPGEILDMREATAVLWVKRGWAIARPDLEEKAKPVEPKKEEPKEEKAAEPAVETAAMHGAPETTEGQGNRRKRR